MCFNKVKSVAPYTHIDARNLSRRLRVPIEKCERKGGYVAAAERSPGCYHN